MLYLTLNENLTEEIDISNNMLMTTDGFSRYVNLISLNLSHNNIGINVNIIVSAILSIAE